MCKGTLHLSAAACLFCPWWGYPEGHCFWRLGRYFCICSLVLRLFQETEESAFIAAFSLWVPQPLLPFGLHVWAYSLTLFRPISLVTPCKLETGLYMTLVLFEWDQGFTEIALLILVNVQESLGSWPTGTLFLGLFLSPSQHLQQQQQNKNKKRRRKTVR